MKIQIKRAYEPARAEDGTRILVERLWPRGLTKEALKLDEWMKEIAPSPELRRWFQHDVTKWVEFQKRYVRELKDHGDLVEKLLRISRSGRLTLIYAARDEVHNSASVLKKYLEEKAG